MIRINVHTQKLSIKKELHIKNAFIHIPLLIFGVTKDYIMGHAFYELFVSIQR